MATRREARETAFQLIFEQIFVDEPMNRIIELAEQTRDVEPDDYIVTVSTGVEEKLGEIDPIIERYSRARSINRLSKAVLAVLRLAVYEIKFVDDIDVSISINEAVEIAKKYAGDDEGGFVNGVLGAFVRAEYPETDGGAAE